LFSDMNILLSRSERSTGALEKQSGGSEDGWGE
jgi:hypothetical protein